MRVFSGRQGRRKVFLDGNTHGEQPAETTACVVSWTGGVSKGSKVSGSQILQNLECLNAEQLMFYLVGSGTTM